MKKVLVEGFESVEKAEIFTAAINGGCSGVSARIVEPEESQPIAPHIPSVDEIVNWCALWWNEEWLNSHGDEYGADIAQLLRGVADTIDGGAKTANEPSVDEMLAELEKAYLEVLIYYSWKSKRWCIRLEKSLGGLESKELEYEGETLTAAIRKAYEVRKEKP
jgi:hypothetical protein